MRNRRLISLAMTAVLALSLAVGAGASQNAAGSASGYLNVKTSNSDDLLGIKVGTLAANTTYNVQFDIKLNSASGSSEADGALRVHTGVVEGSSTKSWIWVGPAAGALSDGEITFVTISGRTDNIFIKPTIGKWVTVKGQFKTDDKSGTGYINIRSAGWSEKGLDFDVDNLILTPATGGNPIASIDFNANGDVSKTFSAGGSPTAEYVAAENAPTTPDTKPSDKVEQLYNFTDVTTKDSYYDAFKFCVDMGLFNGTSATTMGPDVTVSRAMFAAVLGRLNGSDMTKYTIPTFMDVKAGQWYTSYVEWAAANNVITGYPDGNYGIDDPITVEQACLILARYNGFKAGSSGKTLASFTDADKIVDYAKDGVKWAVESGVYAGAGNKLNPNSHASRALMAEMMFNYNTVFGK